MEVLGQSLIFHFVRPHANAQEEAAIAQHVHLRCLLGHQGGLPQREHQDRRPQLQALRDPSDVAQEDERLPVDVQVGIMGRQSRTVGGVCAQNVLPQSQVVEAHPLRRLGEVPDSGGNGHRVVLWKVRTQLHTIDPPAEVPSVYYFQIVEEE